MSDKQFHHGKDHHIWTYCLHLGPFTDSSGGKWDLGIHNKALYRNGPGFVSFANVDGPRDSDYCSGSVNHTVRGLDSGKYPSEGPYEEGCSSFEANREAVKRWKAVAPDEFLAVSNHEAGRPVDSRWVGYRIPTYNEVEVAIAYKKWLEFLGSVPLLGGGGLSMLRELVGRAYTPQCNAEEHEVAFKQATFAFIDAEVQHNDPTKE
jgi:hypothetical protein